MKQCFVLLLITVLAHAQNNNIYWGSYDLTIPGGSGAGNAVQHLSLPDTAPQFFQFAPFERQPLQGSQVSQPAPSPSQQFSPAPQPAQQFRPASAPSQRFSPAPQPTQQFRLAPALSQRFRPAPQPSQQFRPAPQPTQQFRPAPQPTQLFRPATEQSFQQFTPNVQQPPSQVQSQFSLQTVIGSQQSQGTIPASTQTLRVFAPEPSSVRQPEQRNIQQHLSVESTRFSTRPAPAPVARPKVAARQEVQPARVETTSLASSRNYEHDNTGDNELSRFQLYQLKKKQGQQFRPAPQPTQQLRPRTAPQPQIGQDIVDDEVQSNRRKVAVRRKKNRSA